MPHDINIPTASETIRGLQAEIVQLKEQLEYCIEERDCLISLISGPCLGLVEDMLRVTPESPTELQRAYYKGLKRLQKTIMMVVEMKGEW